MDQPKPTTAIPQPWSINTWQNKSVAQPIIYEDEDKLSKTLVQLAALPDLVPTHEIDQLCDILLFAARGQMFVVQGGDCAEAFHEVTRPIVNSKRELLVAQSKMLSEGLGKPIVPIGRIAGQYSKPRSNCYETLSCGSLVNSYRGDNVNGPEKSERDPNPERLCVGYHLAAATLSILRAESGQPMNEIERCTLPSSGVFTSHEALHLPLESTMTRNGYNTSAHMLWIGERTRQLDGGHVEYLRGVKNPVGVKLGPTTNPDDLIEMLDKLNPRGTVGKIVLITRMGAKSVEDKLPALVKAIKKSNHAPVWLCDPCHGNTVSTPSKVKTRIVEQMLEELKLTHLIHAENGSQLGGIHIEQTGEADVTECLDTYNQDLAQAEFPQYRSLCDPRLSKSQALFLIREYVNFAKALAEEASQVETITMKLAHEPRDQILLKAPGLALQV